MPRSAARPNAALLRAGQPRARLASVRVVAGAALAGGLSLLTGTPVWAADQLTPQGVALGRVMIDTAGRTTLEHVVATGGAPVAASHVVLRQAGTNRLLQRDNRGFFHPWDGDPASLMDCGFPVEDGPMSGGQVRMKILDEVPDGLTFPLHVWIALDTPGGLISGHLSVEAAP